MKKPFKIFVKKFLNLFFIITFSQSVAALDIFFEGVDKSLDVEIANSNAARRKGLMYREDLGKDQGMLFIWPDSNKRCIWMKNTPLPLSIAYLSNDGKIQEIYDMVPFSEDSVCSKNPSRMVLEVHLDWFSANNIGIGDKVNFQR